MLVAWSWSAGFVLASPARGTLWIPAGWLCFVRVSFSRVLTASVPASWLAISAIPSLCPGPGWLIRDTPVLCGARCLTGPAGGPSFLSWSAGSPR
jgi:hypothetical protein